jgi:hypothetical protein
MMLTSDLSFIVSMLSFAAHLPHPPHPCLAVVHTKNELHMPPARTQAIA